MSPAWRFARILILAMLAFLYLMTFFVVNWGFFLAVDVGLTALAYWALKGDWNV